MKSAAFVNVRGTTAVRDPCPTDKIDHLPNGSCYLAGETRSFARDIGLEPRTRGGVSRGLPLEGTSSLIRTEGHACARCERTYRASLLRPIETEGGNHSTWLHQPEACQVSGRPPRRSSTNMRE
jgi:hypothetical protein